MERGEKDERSSDGKEKEAEDVGLDFKRSWKKNSVILSGAYCRLRVGL